jgi:hypothetical protein
MPQTKSISEQFNSRSGPLWLWVAGVLMLLNILVLVQCLFSTFRPDLWADSDPFSQFTSLTVAILSLQLTPFARSIWIGKMAQSYVDIDEYERIVNQRVMVKAYRTMGLSMVAVLFMLLLAGNFADIRLTAVSGGYWLMWFAQMFFSLPAIYAGFEPQHLAEPDDAGDDA